jgi:hypothetical protein
MKYIVAIWEGLVKSGFLLDAVNAIGNNCLMTSTKKDNII